MKKVIFFLCTLLFVMGKKEYVMANNSEVRISIEETKVANLYYRVQYKKKNLENDVTYIIQKQNGEEIARGQTVNSVLFEENIPFGDFKICFFHPTNRVVRVSVNNAYMKEQHVLKTIELDNGKSAQTGDNTALWEGQFLFIVSIITLIYVWVERRCQGYEEHL